MNLKKQKERLEKLKLDDAAYKNYKEQKNSYSSLTKIVLILVLFYSLITKLRQKALYVLLCSIIAFSSSNCWDKFLIPRTFYSWRRNNFFEYFWELRPTFQGDYSSYTQRRAGAPAGPSRFWRDSSFAETTIKNFIGILRVIAALLFATFPIRPHVPVWI